VDLCLVHTFRFRPLVRRSAGIALLVGTLLIAINQGMALASGDLSWALAWKVPLIYASPYSVSTAGALLNGRRQAAAELSGLPSGPAREKADHG